MSDGLAERLTVLRSRRGLGLRELAGLTGLDYSDLLALEGQGRRRVGPDVFRRLADFFHTTEPYLTQGTGPAAATVRSGFFRHYDSLGAAEREGLKYAPIQDRVAAVLRYLENAYPTIFGPDQLAARLGYTREALADLLGGVAPVTNPVLNQLMALTGLPRDYFVRGDFFGGAAGEEGGAEPARLAEYYQVVQEAIEAGITPAELRQAVQLMAVRGRGM